MLTLAETLLAALPAHGLAGITDDDGVIVHPVTTTTADAMRGVHVLIGAFADMSGPAPAHTILGARAYDHDGGTDCHDLGELYYSTAELPLAQAVSGACAAAAEWFSSAPSGGARTAPASG
ncbi:hypothetical protein [Streptomyces anulatus]|uniref:hypothetical protein n=1 Tax=Streptomyces anulatus TaxID=1892 RepID=UPI001D18C1E7|nr:hypothetical protein [Streptomyces anulatus]